MSWAGDSSSAKTCILFFTNCNALRSHKWNILSYMWAVNHVFLCSCCILTQKNKLNYTLSFPLVALTRNVHISVAQPLASNDAYNALHGCLMCFSQLAFVDMDGNFGILPCFSHIQLYWGVWLVSGPEEQNLLRRLDLCGNSTHTEKRCNHAKDGICAF